MNLNQLKAFVKVVQVKSYQEAAETLGVSQPAITQRIKVLEDYFQTKLLTRSHEGFSLTPQGETFYQISQEILEKWSRLEYYYLGNEPTGNLVIGASTIPSEYLLPSLLKQFRIKFPAVRFRMQVSGSAEIEKLLKNRSVDLIVTGQPEHEEDIDSIPVFDDELKVITQPGEEVSKLEINDLFRFDWILREAHSNTRQAFEKALLKQNHTIEELHVVGEMGSTEAVIAAVEAGLGISVVSSLAANRAQKYGRVRAISIKDLDISRKFYVSYLKENQNALTIAAFLDFITQYDLIAGTERTLQSE
ncbi:LysR family transcriptional regulator [Virgibacillus sp. MSP4-1]|nr:LysR family transcriptional regulator [Virgibacillus sp. MSP4-1]